MDDILEGLYQAEQYPNDESDLMRIPEMETDRPLLHDFMRFEFYKGEPVNTPDVKFSVQGGQLWVTLSDGERRRSVRLACKSFEDGLDVLEGVISSGQIKTLWRYWTQFNGKKQKKKTGG